jgi:hypothetical protein
MEDWEIFPMGVIPTRTLIVTNVRTNHLFNSFKDDLELFPGVEVVRIAPQISEERRRVVATTATNTTNMLNASASSTAHHAIVSLTTDIDIDSDNEDNEDNNNTSTPTNVVFVGDAATIAAADETIANAFSDSNLIDVLDLANATGEASGDQRMEGDGNPIPSVGVKQIILDPFEALMRARNIELRLDAQPIWRCGCSGSTGY